MKKILFLSLVITFFGFTSCDLGDDSNMDCVTGPVILAIDLVQEGSNTNLFQNGTFQQSNFTAVDDQGTVVEHNFLVQDGRPFLRLRLGNYIGERVVTLKLNSETSVDIEYTMAAVEGNCTGYRITEFDIPGYDFEQSTTTGVIIIYI